MPEYTVTWSIDIDATTPEDAARKARAIQQNPASSAVCFDVAPFGEPEASCLIDLENHDAHAPEKEDTAG